MYNFKWGRLALLIVAFAALNLLVVKAAASPAFSGILAFIPSLIAFAVLAMAFVYRKRLGKFIGLSALSLLLMTSCDTVPASKIGVYVQNYGKDISDYSLVMGKVPFDWFSKSSWTLQFDARNTEVHVDPTKMSCRDGIEMIVDPSVLVALIRSDAACKKYAQQFSAYGDNQPFQDAITGTVLKETLNACRSVVQTTASDTFIFNRSKYYELMESLLASTLENKYGIKLVQFSVESQVNGELQKAIENRLLEQEKTKTTLASLENERALIEKARIQRERILIENSTYTPSYLEKLRLDYSYNAWVELARSPNKAFVSGTPMSFLAQ